MAWMAQVQHAEKEQYGGAYGQMPMVGEKSLWLWLRKSLKQAIGCRVRSRCM